MVSQLGMSAKLGPVEWGGRYNKLSSRTKALIEEEVQKTLSDAYERARKLLLSKRKELDLSYATVTAEIDGKVSRAQLQEGNLVNAGGSDPLLTTIV